MVPAANKLCLVREVNHGKAGGGPANATIVDGARLWDKFGPVRPRQVPTESGIQQLK